MVGEALREREQLEARWINALTSEYRFDRAARELGVGNDGALIRSRAPGTAVEDARPGGQTVPA